MSIYLILWFRKVMWWDGWWKLNIGTISNSSLWFNWSGHGVRSWVGWSFTIRDVKPWVLKKNDGEVVGELPNTRLNSNSSLRWVKLTLSGRGVGIWVGAWQQMVNVKMTSWPYWRREHVLEPWRIEEIILNKQLLHNQTKTSRSSSWSWKNTYLDFII